MNAAGRHVPSASVPDSASPTAATARGVSTTRSALVFTAAAVVTLVAGVVLERSGDAIAGDIGLSGVLFGPPYWPRRPRCRSCPPG